MPNKNNKKRRRVVMTSDVVPAGSREEARAPEIKADEVATPPASTEPEPAMRDADEGVALVSDKSELTRSDAAENNADEVTEPAAPMTALGGVEGERDGRTDGSDISDGS